MELKKFIKKIVKSVDFLGYTPKFITQGKENFRTIFGGVFSLIVFTIGMFSCFFFGKEIILKQDPILIYSTYYDEIPKKYEFKQEKFGFFVGIEDKNSNYFIDPKIYIINFTFFDSKRKIDKGETIRYDIMKENFILEKCNLTKHFYNDIKFLFENQELNNLLCLKQEDLEKIFLKGSWTNEEFSYFEIRISSCKNKTHNHDFCKPQKEIDEVLNWGFFVLDYVDTIFQPKNYSFPNFSLRKDFFTSLSNKFYKEVIFYMKNIDYLTDTGIILSNIDQKNYLQLDYNYEIYDFRKTDDFFKCLIRLSFNRDIYHRKYIKIQDIIAQIGGFVKGLMIISNMLNYFYSKTNFYIYLINSLFINENIFKPTTVEQDKKIGIVREKLNYKIFSQSSNNIDKRKTNLTNVNKNKINNFLNITDCINNKKRQIEKKDILKKSKFQLDKQLIEDNFRTGPYERHDYCDRIMNQYELKQENNDKYSLKETGKFKAFNDDTKNFDYLKIIEDSLKND